MIGEVTFERLKQMHDSQADKMAKVHKSEAWKNMNKTANKILMDTYTKRGYVQYDGGFEEYIGKTWKLNKEGLLTESEFSDFINLRMVKYLFEASEERTRSRQLEYEPFCNTNEFKQLYEA